MKSVIDVVIRPYTEKDICISFHYDPDDYYAIYNRMMKITGGDHEISSNAASWCELATVGEIYEFREGKIEIVELE